MVWLAILVALEAFLLGSIPFGFLLYRLRTGHDIRREGSGNIGATNVMRRAGKALGILTLFLDAAKGFAAVLIADRLTYYKIDQPYVFMHTGSNVPTHHFALLAMAMVLAVLGHMYTPWLRGKGGKGVATALGVFLAVAPQAVAGAFVVFLLTVLLTRYVSLASILSAVALPIVFWWRYGIAYPTIVYVATVAGALLVILRHRANIGRLLAGTENRLGARKPVSSAPPTVPPTVHHG